MKFLVLAFFSMPFMAQAACDIFIVPKHKLNLESEGFKVTSGVKKVLADKGYTINKGPNDLELIFNWNCKAYKQNDQTGEVRCLNLVVSAQLIDLSNTADYVVVEGFSNPRFSGPANPETATLNAVKQLPKCE